MRSTPTNVFVPRAIHLVPLAILVCAGGCSYAAVGAGEVAVVWTPTGVAEKVLHEGVWDVGYYDKATIYNARSQGRDEQLEVLASDGARLVLDASIRYHIEADQAVELHRDLGEDYYAILLGPTLRSQARRVVGRYRPEQIYSTERELIEREIREGVETAIKGRHITLEAVLIRNVRLPDEIQAAINSKLEAEQGALKMKFVIDKAHEEAARALVDAQAAAARSKVDADAHAEKERIDASARADARRIDAQAEDDYERIVQQHITEPLLRLQQIDALKSLAASPNSKVIYLGATGGKTPQTMLDIK